MDLNLAAFECAVRDHLGAADIDQGLRACVRAVCKAEPDDATGLTFAQAAEALLLAVLNNGPVPLLANLTLTGASGKSLTLSPAQAKAHYCAGDWIDDTPAKAIAQAFRVGAEMLDEIGQPEASSVTITEARGEVQVCVYAQDGGLGMFAFFGTDLDPTALQRSVRLDGATLRNIGFQARSQTTVMAPLQPNPIGFSAPPTQVH